MKSPTLEAEQWDQAIRDYLAQYEHAIGDPNYTLPSWVNDLDSNNRVAFEGGAPMIASLRAFRKLVSGDDSLENQRIVEIGFGTDLRRAHLAGLALYKANPFGIEPSLEGVEEAKYYGFNAVQGSVEHIATLLPRDYRPDAIVSNRVFEAYPMQLSAAANRNVTVYEISDQEINATAERYFKRMFDVLSNGGLGLHLTTCQLIPDRRSLTEIGYDVLVHNQRHDFHSPAKFLTAVRKPDL